VNNRERGFSLIEWIVVSVVIAVLLSAGFHGVRLALAREEAEGWARTVAYEIAAGQQAAVTRRASVIVEFQNQTFSVVMVGGGTLRRETLPAHLSFGGTQRSVTFDRRGVPSGDSSLSLTSTTTGTTYGFTIEPGTGRVISNAL
jgi:prepilin-type N-terminal cleavage/methylation domain-containing protein